MENNARANVSAWNSKLLSSVVIDDCGRKVKTAFARARQKKKANVTRANNEKRMKSNAMKKLKTYFVNAIFSEYLLLFSCLSQLSLCLCASHEMKKNHSDLMICGLSLSVLMLQLNCSVSPSLSPLSPSLSVSVSCLFFAFVRQSMNKRKKGKEGKDGREGVKTEWQVTHIFGSR